MPIVLTPISQPTGLVTTERAQQNANLAALSSDSLQSLLLAASGAIELATGRTFARTSYREYLNGANYPGEAIRLSQYPVLSIDRVAYYIQPALRVYNTDRVTNQRATIATTDSGVTLVRVASGVTTTTTFTYASYPTLTSLAGAISGLGNGWSATVDNPFSLYPSADLKPLQGAMSAMVATNAVLYLYTEDWTTPWRVDAEAGILWGTFPTGHQNLRVDYTAGYDSVPQAIQEACVELAQHLSQLASVKTGVSSETVGPYSQSFFDVTKLAGGLPPNVKTLVSPYVDHSRLVSPQ